MKISSMDINLLILCTWYDQMQPVNAISCGIVHEDQMMCDSLHKC